MPIWASVDPIRRHWLTWVVLVDCLYGGINMFGRAEGPSQLLLRSILPLPLWYGLLPLAAALITLGYSVRGGMIGTFAWGSFAVAAILTIANGTALSYGGAIPLLGWAGVHIMIIYDVGSGLDEAREQSQRRP
jgi:hypothetical protein